MNWVWGMEGRGLHKMVWFRPFLLMNNVTGHDLPCAWVIFYINFDFWMKSVCRRELLVSMERLDFRFMLNHVGSTWVHSEDWRGKVKIRKVILCVDDLTNFFLIQRTYKFNVFNSIYFGHIISYFYQFLKNNYSS